MTRLIDADVAIKEYTNAFTSAFGKSAGEMFKGVISQIPTAYNVDKVLEELDDASYYYCWHCINAAIEIVRKGGVNDD